MTGAGSSSAGDHRDAIVIGSGPNGLAAAITLAQAGRSVLVLEAEDTPGGGCRSAELTLPGFVHDVCAAVHPLALASPFFRELPLARYGLVWLQPPIPLAHPFDDGTAAILGRSIADTAATLGADAAAYRRLMTPLVDDWPSIVDDLLGPLHWPCRPIPFVRFGWWAIRSARALAREVFRGERARALFAGLAAHAMLPLDQLATAGFGLTLGMLGHAVGWPLARGGSQTIADALVAHLRSLGGELCVGWRVASLDDLPPTRLVLADVTPRQLLALAGARLAPLERCLLARYRYGPAAFKLDWALAGPIPWRAPECCQAGTIHLGGTLDEIAASERTVWQGGVSERPYVILVQPSPFDPTRAPPGWQTAWAYCHVPNGSTGDVTARIEAQVERFAPGFGERILARSVLPPAALERWNANNVGGDISGGVMDLGQLYTRPTPRLDPYATSVPGLYLCSSSTPPGGGVHGRCGYFAARSALVSHAVFTPGKRR